MQSVGALFGGDHYVSGNAVAEMPGFPEQWRGNPLNPDGTLEPVKDSGPYSLSWVKQYQIRKIFLESDLLYSFAQLVAGMTNAPITNYFRGGGGHYDALEGMILNVVTTALQREMAPQLPQGSMTPTQLREQAMSLRELVRQALPVLQRTSLERNLASVYGGPDVPQQMSEAARQQQEDMFRAAVDKLRRQEAPSAKAAAPVIPVSVPTRAASSGSLDRDRMMMPPPVYTPLSQEEMDKRARLAVSGGAAKEDDVGLSDPRVLMMYLLLRGGINKAEIEAVTRIYGDRSNVLDDPENRSRIIRDAQLLERMLRSSTPTVEELSAPEHTGHIFFTAPFMAAVNRAGEVVRSVCEKPFALDIDLMTHVAVRGDFANLVAYFLNSGTSRTLIRLGGSTERAQREADLTYAALVQKFRKLTRTYRHVPRPGVYLTFQGIPDGVVERYSAENLRRNYMRSKHMYYSDGRQDRVYDVPL